MLSAFVWNVVLYGQNGDMHICCRWGFLHPLVDGGGCELSVGAEGLCPDVE
jgi:hypothetical protein